MHRQQQATIKYVAWERAKVYVSIDCSFHKVFWTNSHQTWSINAAQCSLLIWYISSTTEIGWQYLISVMVCKSSVRKTSMPLVISAIKMFIFSNITSFSRIFKILIKFMYISCTGNHFPNPHIFHVFPGAWEPWLPHIGVDGICKFLHMQTWWLLIIR